MDVEVSVEEPISMVDREREVFARRLWASSTLLSREPGGSWGRGVLHAPFLIGLSEQTDPMMIANHLALTERVLQNNNIVATLLTVSWF
jgi:hypothetical protein